MALAGVLRRSRTERLQQGVVELAAEISGSRAPVTAQRDGLRSGREVSRRWQCSVHALLPRRHLRVPVLSRALPRSRAKGPAQSLHLLRIKRGRSEIQQDARNGSEQALA